MRSAAITGRATLNTLACDRLDRVRRRQPHELEYALASGQMLNVRYTPDRARRPGARLCRHHGAQAGRAGRSAEGSRAPGRARQHAGRARLHRREPQHRRLQRSLRRHVSGAARAAAAGATVSRVPALSGRARLLRRRRRRGAGREARGKPAQSVGQDVRGPHPGRPRLRSLSPAGGAGRHGDGDHRHHRPQGAPRKRSAHKEAELHVALDNMPGALAYTDDELQHRRLQRSLRRDVPGAAASCCSPDAPIPISCAIWRSTATTAKATSTRWSRGGWRACAIRRARRSRTARRTAASTGSAAARSPRAAR